MVLIPVLFATFVVFLGIILGGGDPPAPPYQTGPIRRPWETACLARRRARRSAA